MTMPSSVRSRYCLTLCAIPKVHVDYNVVLTDYCTALSVWFLSGSQAYLLGCSPRGTANACVGSITSHHPGNVFTLAVLTHFYAPSHELASVSAA